MLAVFTSKMYDIYIMAELHTCHLNTSILLKDLQDLGTNPGVRQGPDKVCLQRHQVRQHPMPFLSN